MVPSGPSVRPCVRPYRKSIGKFFPKTKQNKTRPECRLNPYPTARLNLPCFVLFCWLAKSTIFGAIRRNQAVPWLDLLIAPQMVDFASQQNKTKQNTADSVVRSGKDSDGIRAVFCFVLFCFGDFGRLLADFGRLWPTFGRL